MARIQHAIVMAAGRGQRMMPLTADIPKAMAPYNGTTLIAQGIDRIRTYIKHIHITVGYHGALLAEHVIRHGVSSVFNTEGRSNSWWIYNTLLSELDEPIFVLTCDNVVMELNRHKPSDIYCSGIQIINPRKVNRLTREEGDFYSVWAQLIAQRQVIASRVYPKTWFTVDTMDQLSAVRRAAGGTSG